MWKQSSKALAVTLAYSFVLLVSGCQEYIEQPQVSPEMKENSPEHHGFRLEEQQTDFANFRLGDWNILYEETFEGPEQPFYTYVHTQFPKPHSFQVLSSLALRGKNAGKFELRKGDPMVTDTGIRSEVLFSMPPENDMWYSFGLYLPSSGFASDRDNDILSQWHQGAGSPPISLRVREDRFVFRYNSSSNVITDFDLGPAGKNAWHRFVFHIIHAPSENGIVEIWRNGVKIFSRTNANMYDRELPRWKVGIYKPTWETKTTDTDLRVIYLDNIRMGNSRATLQEMDPSQNNLRGWGPFIPKIKSYTIINTVTQKEVGSLQNGGKINIRLLSTDRINIRANFDEPFNGSVLFELSGNKKSVSTDNNFPFSMYGESSSGTFFNAGGTPVGDYVLKSKTFAEPSRNGKVGEETTIGFTVIDQNQSTVDIPKISGFSLVKANVDQIYGPLEDGDLIDLKKTGTHKLSIESIMPASFTGEIRFKLSGNLNRTSTAMSAPFTLYGHNNGDYAFGSTGLPAGQYILEATPVLVADGLTNIGPTSTLRFWIVEDASGIQNLSSIKSLTLVRANSNSDWGTIENGSVFSAAEIGTHKLTIRANLQSSFRGRVLFELTGRVNRTSFSTSFAPYVLNRYTDGKYSFGEGLPVGRYELKVTPLVNVNGIETPEPTEKWVFEIR